MTPVIDRRVTRQFDAAMTVRRFLFFALTLAGAFTSGLGSAGDTGSVGARLVASPENGWPQWRGPRRDGICEETGLLQHWPEGGPPLLWKTNGLGRGYSAPVMTGERLYLAGEVEDELRIFALDLQGRPLWAAPNGRSWKGPYPGARASCTFSDGRLYHLNAHGRVACLDAANGSELWTVDLVERFGGKVNTWAYSENLLVDGPRVIVTPGGTRALVAALDKRTGGTLWASEPLRLGPSEDPAQGRLAEPVGETDGASYASPILLTHGGRRQIVNCSLRHVFGMDADTGRLLWTRPMPSRYLVIAATPVLVGDAVYVTAPDAEQRGLYGIQMQNSGVSIDKRWTGPLDTCHGGVVLVNDILYGAWYRSGKGYAGLDTRTGIVRCQTKEISKGSVLFADRRLYCLSEEGEMVLLDPNPQTFAFAGRFRLVPGRKTDAWTHPVILNGRLYLRYHETLFCYDVRAGRQ
jgi:outer membrane protein assembly factor BamB